MERAEMVEYLRGELADLKKAMDEQETALKNETDKFERVGIAAKLGKAKDMYYHFWMVCNDLGIAD